MADIFHQSMGLHPKLNNFNNSQEKYFDMNMNRLIPIAIYDCIPGDFFNIKHKIKIRCEPFVSPELSNLDVNAAAFFTSYRTLWDKFSDFITGKDPQGSTLEPGSLQHPYILLRNDFKPHDIFVNGKFPYPVFTSEIGSNADYAGLPSYYRPTSQVSDGAQQPISALPFLAMLSIWNWYFRDSELQEEIKYCLKGNRFMTSTTSIVDNDEVREIYKNLASLFNNPLNPNSPSDENKDFLYFNWNKDYFTSAFLRQTQGTPPTINFDGVANMTQQFTPTDTLHFGKMTINNTTSGNGLYQFPSNRYLGTDRNAWASGNVQSARDMTNSQFFLTTGSAGTQSSLDVSFNAQALQQGLFKNLQMNVMTTLTPAQFRYIFQYNLFLERRMYAGFRYDDYLKFFFGLSPRNEVLQQPELIGAYKTPIVVSEVLQTSETTSTSPQGNMAGHGISFDFNSLGKYRVKEYGCIIVYMWISTKGMYSQGIDKTLEKFDYLDYVNPAFVNLGEQPVYSRELYFSKDKQYNNSIFGYQSMYNEYRYKPDGIAGNLRKDFSYWHLGRLFNDDSKPVLNSSFIVSDADEARLFSVTDTFKTPPFIVRSGLKVNTYRPLPLFGTPGRIDHIYGERFQR